MAFTHRSIRLKATTEGLEEVRYATEFEAASVDTYVAEPFDGATPSTTKHTSEVFPSPTAFDTRNIGVSLEVQPVLKADGKTVDLSLVVTHTRLDSIEHVTVQRESTSEKRIEKVISEQPRFSTLKVVTQLNVTDRQPELLNIFRVPKEPGQLELFVLSVQVEPTKK